MTCVMMLTQTLLGYGAFNAHLWPPFASGVTLKRPFRHYRKASLPSTAVYCSRLSLAIENSVRILRWLSTSICPLCLLELGAAVGCHSSAHVSREQAIQDQLTICEPFVKVTAQGVGLVHGSRDSLLRKEKDDLAALDEFRINLAEAHLEVA